MASSVSPWSHLPRELLGLVIDRLESPPELSRFHAFWSRSPQLRPYHAARFRAALRSGQSANADRARFRAVCRSWCSAMREHVTTPSLLPWIVTSDGFMAPSDASSPSSACLRLPSLPKNARCIGSTESWVALDCITDDKEKKRSYFLPDPFSNTTVPLPELDAGDVSVLFEVRKVLMRSTADDVIAVMTNSWDYPIILVRPGKGVWLPEPRAAPFIYIIDIAFLDDKIYGITQSEDLVSLDIGFDNDGVPNVTNFARLIKHPPGNNNDDHCQEVLIEEDDDTSATKEISLKTGDDTLSQGVTYWEDDEVPYDYDNKDLVGIIWYLVKSCGKLFVVKRRLQWSSYSTSITRKMEVFELNLRTGAWVPISGGLHGHAFFTGERFCKSIAAHGDIKEDTIYFVDTGETFNVISHTISPPQRDIDHGWSTWIFSRALVV